MQPQRTPDADLERDLARLRDKAEELARLSILSRVQLLRSALDGYVAIATDAVAAICALKGIDPSSNDAGEEWLAGPMVVVRNIRLLIETLQRLDAGEPVLDRSRLRTHADGRVVVDVFPHGGLEKLVQGMFRGEVWMQPGQSVDAVLESAASHYKIDPGKRRGHVALILGGGNVSSIPAGDALYKMFVEGKVCVLKMNPVNAALGPYLERAFSACIERGYLAIVYGGNEVGEKLIHHSAVDEIHITGSDRTYDFLMWGPPGPDREARKTKNEPLIDKPFSAELGNISPWLIAPGTYTDAEIKSLAMNIAGAIANNASFNCNSPKLLVLPKAWGGRERLLGALTVALARAPTRLAYYPGAEERWSKLVSSHPSVERVGDPKPGELAWALIRDLDASRADEVCFQLEPWCAVVSEVPIGGDDPERFLSDAVTFANDRVWGTLAATIVAPPKWERSTEGARAIDRTIADLKYGAVSVNCWPGVVYSSMRLPWGAHPSSTAQDIQSGQGWVHNTFMLQGIDKAVLRMPLVPRPSLPYFVGHRAVAKLGKRLFALESHPSIWKIPGLLTASLSG